MNDNVPRYAPPDEVVQLAKDNGFTTAEIVRIVSGGITYREALKVAHTFAPLLDLTIKEFMSLRKNE